MLNLDKKNKQKEKKFSKIFSIRWVFNKNTYHCKKLKWQDKNLHNTKKNIRKNLDWCLTSLKRILQKILTKNNKTRWKEIFSSYLKKEKMKKVKIKELKKWKNLSNKSKIQSKRVKRADQNKNQVKKIKKWKISKTCQ